MSIVRSIVERIRALFAWWIADIQRRPSLIGKAASLLIGLFVICCVCSVPFAALRTTGQAVGIVATNTPPPQPTAPPVPTSTPVPTEPPPPTATLPPTAIPPTAIPTDTPTTGPTAPPPPTETPIPPTAVPVAEAPKLTDEERAATLALGSHVGKIGDALGEIGKLAQNAKNTAAWRNSMIVQIATVKGEHQLLLDLKVPPKIGGFRAAVLNATSDCDAAMTSLARGLDNNSTADLRQAGVLMNSCGQKIKEAQPEMDALLAQS